MIENAKMSFFILLKHNDFEFKWNIIFNAVFIYLCFVDHTFNINYSECNNLKVIITVLANVASLLLVEIQNFFRDILKLIESNVYIFSLV